MDLTSFPESESAKRMLSYVTKGWYDRSYIGKWLYEVMGIELDIAEKIIAELPYQIFVETATWGLSYHELKWGLPVRPDLSYEDRRKLILQKRGYHAPITPFYMEKHLKVATGFDAHIADIHDPGPYGYHPPHPNIFKVFFLGGGTLDKGAAYAVLDRLKQPHTVYKINDRVEACFDNRGQERVALKNIWTKIRLDSLQAEKHRIFQVAVNLYAGIDHSGHESVAGLQVETRNKNYWLLDGAAALDGSKKLDSIYKKEQVE